MLLTTIPMSDVSAYQLTLWARPDLIERLLAEHKGVQRSHAAPGHQQFGREHGTEVSRAS